MTSRVCVFTVRVSDSSTFIETSQDLNFFSLTVKHPKWCRANRHIGARAASILSSVVHSKMEYHWRNGIGERVIYFSFKFLGNFVSRLNSTLQVMDLFI